ncbi:lycopene cyclase domain-containing protein [Promicromonospora aerolata]|uniref:Lycopene cyclase domain-containing protein n=1 Tax=Promicromonospora aerolata TaxID=195749 RepID=A0ABW4V2A8_9MICO
MIYLLLALGFLTVAAVVAVVAHRSAGRRADRSAGWRAVTLAAVALLILTVVFDNLMIASGLFAYSDAHISGVRIGLAPVEDLAYPLAAVVLLPALWSLFGGRHDR